MTLGKGFEFDLPKHQFDYITYSHYYRGLLINEFTGLEKLVEEYIVTYFVGKNDKGAELTSILLDRMTFEAKRTAFRTLIEAKAVRDGFIPTKKHKSKYKDIHADLETLNSYRVQFAHFIVVMPNSGTSDYIGLANFRDGVDVIWYSPEKFNRIMELIKSTYKKIELLIKEI